MSDAPDIDLGTAGEGGGGRERQAASDAAFRLPRGDLLRSHVVDDPAVPLRTALDRELTGYAVFESSDALLLDGERRGVLTFEAGVPVLAYEVGSDAAGPAAVAAFADPGPYRVELYELPEPALAEAHGAEALRVAPATPATELADAPALAERTRAAAPAERGDGEPAGESNAVAAFLADEERIDAIREQARDEARQRAREWGLDDALADGDGGGDPVGSPDGDGADGPGGSVPPDGERTGDEGRDDRAGGDTR